MDFRLLRSNDGSCDSPVFLPRLRLLPRSPSLLGLRFYDIFAPHPGQNFTGEGTVILQDEHC